MIYYLSQYLLEAVEGTEWAERLSALRVFRYITVRSAGAAITALCLSWWLGPAVIAWLKRLKFGQEYTDRAHETGDFKARLLDKRGTPTMGGVLIVLVVDLSALLWAQWNELLLLTVLSLVVLAGLGFYDDYAKIARQNAKGVTSTVKLAVQTLLGLFVGVYLWFSPQPEWSRLISDVMVPFLKDPLFTDAALAGLIVTVLAIVGSSNAVNVTDGLDGLAIGLTVIVAIVFLIMTYIAGNAIYSKYLLVPFVPGAGELTVFCAALIGAGLGFLWYNCHPAQVFMGDTGSLALGGTLGIIAVLIHQPFVLVIAGGVFVAEAGSVMLQTGWFKFTRKRHGEGRRLFLMAPLHHHFEKKNWYESQVVMRFYILGVLCAVLALSTLKLR
jgi:phospho-N-acetylmuramoyl-pentapeptide-transferase